MLQPIAAAREPLRWGAVLLVPEGGVQVRVQAGISTVARSRPLRPGDEVTAGSSGATLALANGGTHAMGPGQIFTVPPVPATVPAGFIALTDALEKVLDDRGEPLTRAEFESRFVVRGTPKEPALVGLAPRGRGAQPGRILEDRPTFRWRARADPVKDQKVSLFPQGERTPLWSESVPAPAREIAFPAGQPALTPGSYVWRIEAEVGGKKEDDSRAFTVPPPEERDRLRRGLERLDSVEGPAKAETRIQLAALLLEQRYFGLAETSLRAAMKQAPNDPTLPLLVAEVYRQQGLAVPPELVPGQ